MSGRGSWSPNVPLLVTGLVGFAVAYAVPPAITFGACNSGTSWGGCADQGMSLIPLAGPFLFLDVPDTAGSYTALMVTAGVVQPVGLVVAVVGLAIGSPRRLGLASTPLGPGLRATPGGAELWGTF